MNNKETNRNLKDTKLVAATKKKKLKECYYMLLRC